MAEVLGGGTSIDRFYASLRCSLRLVTDEAELRPVSALFQETIDHTRYEFQEFPHHSHNH